MPTWVKNWLARHQHPVSQGLHAIGIPMLPIAIYLGLAQLIDGAWSLWWRPVVLVVVSYLLQGLGHWIEGNDMGELIVIKKMRGKPYVAISPKYATKHQSHSHTQSGGNQP